jgi:hypothetical protein
MSRNSRDRNRWPLRIRGSFGLLLAVGLASMPSAAEPIEASPAREMRVAQAEPETPQPDEQRPLEPRYQPREPLEEPWYNTDYLMGMTRGVANSSIVPAGRVPLYVLTIPLDIVFLPFSLIAGFFG